MKTENEQLIADLKDTPMRGPISDPDVLDTQQSDAPPKSADKFDLTILKGKEKAQHIINAKMVGRRTRDIAVELGVKDADVSRVWGKVRGKVMADSRYLDAIRDIHNTNLTELTDESMKEFRRASGEKKLNLLPHFLKLRSELIDSMTRRATQNQTNVQVNNRVEGFRIFNRDGEIINSKKGKPFKIKDMTPSESSGESNDVK